MTDVYLNLIASSVGSTIEENDPESLGHPAAECERIVKKTGIQRRPLASSDEYTSDLACRAVQILIDAGGARVDALVVCTQTPDHLIPGVSSRVHGRLGLRQDCFAVDINQGCSGFVYGMQMVVSMIRANSANHAVLVNADCYSKLIRPADLATRVLFGDAAAASLFSIQPAGWRVRYSRCYSDGSGYDDFVAYGSAIRTDAEHETGIHMKGADILGFALRVVPESIHRALQDIGLRIDDLRLVAFHQANSFIIGKLAAKLGLRAEQVPQNCRELGNTVSASIPLLLQEQQSALKPGDLVLAAGFGVGLSWGVALLEFVGGP